MAQDFRKLKVWGIAHEFSVRIYRAAGEFPKDERYGLASQIKRASASVSTNIAEGCGRGNSNGMLFFLRVALGSSKECENLLFLSNKLGYIPNKDFDELSDAADHISAMLVNLIKKVRSAAPQKSAISKRLTKNE